MAEHRGEQEKGLGPMDKAVEAVGGMMGTMKAGLGSMSDSAFVTNARRSDLYEIQAARIAEQRARSPEVRQLAQRMIQDHTTSSNQLLAALRTSQGSDLMDELKDDLDQHRQTMLDHLREASDDEFDGVYLTQQKMAHMETLTLFEGFESSGDNAQLVSYARGMLPILHEHKELVNRIEGSGSARS
jgi:putative membrane protein